MENELERRKCIHYKQSKITKPKWRERHREKRCNAKFQELQFKTKTNKQTNVSGDMNICIAILESIILTGLSHENRIESVIIRMNKWNFMHTFCRIVCSMIEFITHTIYYLFVRTFCLPRRCKKQSSLLTPNMYICMWFLCLDLTLHKNKCRNFYKYFFFR